MERFACNGRFFFMETVPDAHIFDGNFASSPLHKGIKICVIRLTLVLGTAKTWSDPTIRDECNAATPVFKHLLKRQSPFIVV